MRYAGSKKDQEFFERRRKAGVKSPLDNKPQLDSSLLWVWNGFMVLSRGRPYISGFSAVPGSIPFPDIDAYARRYRIEGDEFEEFLHYILAMDAAYLEQSARQAEAQSKVDK